MLGGSKVVQLDAAMDAVRLSLTAEQLARLDQPA
jgi:aryl-alcohol dehydrogenase-like predicted oxidoreductase